jgi:3-oxoacyl-[acyl-carrier-protein] synthase-3
MAKLTAAITAVNGWVPEDILTNKDIEKMVDTSDEWITTRTGIKTRHILKGKGLGSSDMGAKAVIGLLEKRGISPDEIDMLICPTVTPDYAFPATSNLIAHKAGIKNAFHYDVNAACSSFIYSLVTASKFIESGSHKKIIVVGADKMSGITDYTDRNTCPLFGDASGAVLIEPNSEGMGVQDSILKSDGFAFEYLHMKAGGSVKPPSHETVDAREHFIYQEGKTVFKFAVSNMADTSIALMEKNNLKPEDINFVVPHQANLRIIEAVGRRMGIQREQIMINIDKYGNTTSATIPLCLWEWENLLKKGDNIILTAFGGGFTWGAIYLKWAYNND